MSFVAIQVQSWNHNTGVVLVLTKVVCPTFVKPLGTGKKNAAFPFASGFEDWHEIL